MSSVFTKNAISAAVAAAIVGAVPAVAVAQEQSAEDDVEVITVTGIRGSIASAQELKRNADTVKDIITASDIGALPDKSVTEALQRVSGVTIERFAASDDPKHFADEGTGVLIRGLDRVRSEINGRDAFSARPNGGLSYEDFPAELLGAVEVVKNQTADLISGGIAGTVNLITRKPFDSDEQLIAVSAKGSYGDYREELTPSFTALFSDNWETNSGKFGFLISGSSSEFRTLGDGFGIGNYHSRGDRSDGNPNGFEGDAVEGQPAGSKYYVPANFTLSTAENDRERQGLTSSIQWQSPDERFVATLEHIHSNATLEWNERVVASGDRGFLEANPTAGVWSGNADEGRPLTVDNNGFLTSGIGANTSPSFPLQFRSRYNFNENTVDDTSLNLKFQATDDLTLHFDYQRVESEQIVHNNNITSRINGDQTAQYAPYYLDLRGDTPNLEFLDRNTAYPDESVGGPFVNAEGVESVAHPILRIASGLQQEEHNEAESDSFQFDIDYVLDGVFTGVKAGVYYSEKELTIRNTDFEAWQALGTPWNSTASYNASPQVVPELYERVSFADHYNGDTVSGPFNSFLFPRIDLAQNYAQTLREGCGYWIATCARPYEDSDNRVFSHFAPRHISSSKTERTEFYVRGDFEFDVDDIYVSGNVGLRSVNYKLQSTGGVSLPAELRRGEPDSSRYRVMQENFPEIFALASSGTVPSTIDGTDYSTLLPSFNINAEVVEDVIVRFGVSQGLYYPSLVDAANKMVVSLEYEEVFQDETIGLDEETNPVVDLRNIEISGNARNPFLEPEESVNYDLTTEWYFAETGSLTFGLFRKDLSNIIRDTTGRRDVDVPGVGNYTVSTHGPQNTGSGTIQGFELSYTQFYDMLPGAWSGLGLQVNYTYIEQDGLEDPNDQPREGIRFTTDGTPVTDNRNSFRQFSGLPLEGYSDENFNIVGMYEYEGISARIAYTWRSDYLLSLRESEEFVPVYQKAQGNMDATLFYDINDNVKVGVEVSNVLDSETETQYQLNQEGTLTDAFNFTSDRRYAFSVRAKF